MGLVHQHEREFETAKVFEWLRNGRPGEHGSLGTGNIPPCPAEALNQHVAALLVDLAELIDAILRAVERSHSRNLDRCVGAVIEIGFDACKRRNQRLVARDEAHSPAGHGIGFGHGGEFDSDVFRPINLQDRGRGLLEVDFIVSEV